MNAGPFLKWAGSKRRLVSTIQRRMPVHYNRYFEPFAGSAALFFGVRPQSAILADANTRLIRTYRAIRDNVELVIALLGDFLNNPTCYNSSRRYSLLVDGLTDAEVAAWFIYLNKTAFNGLYRVNKQNVFNVPFGKYINPTICDDENLRACSEVLQGVELRCACFNEVIAEAQGGDFIYCDPPYLPISATASFTDYTADGFGAREHYQLRDAVLDATARGVHVLVSNSAAPLAYELYRPPKFQIEEITAGRSIAASAPSRGDMTELLISNYLHRP